MLIEIQPGRSIEVNVESLGKCVNEIIRINTLNKELICALQSVVNAEEYSAFYSGLPVRVCQKIEKVLNKAAEQGCVYDT